MKAIFNPLLLVVLALALSCSPKSDSGAIIFSGIDNESSFWNMVDSVRLIELKADSSLILGRDPMVSLYNNEIYIADVNGSAKIYRFNKQGALLNTIGSKGRGPEEYTGINSFNIANDTIYIFSHPSLTVSKYLINGTFINRFQIEVAAQQGIKCDNGYLIYCGYGMSEPFRFALWNSAELKYMNETQAKVLNFSEITDIFTTANGSIYARETYNRHILKFNGSAMEPYIEFDFGKYAIPDEYFNFPSPFEAAEFLFKREFATIRKFYESEKWMAIEFIINKMPTPQLVYGLSKKTNKGEWRWFSLGENNSGALAGNLKGIDGDRLTFLLDPSMAESITDKQKRKIINPNLLDSITENSNYLIAEIKL